MYKILTRMHTKRDGIYRFYMVEDSDGRFVEYSTDSLDEVRDTALMLLKQVGYLDLKIVEDKPYYVEIDNIIDNTIQSEDINKALEIMGQVGYEDLYLTNDATYGVQLIWGQKPMPEQKEYTVKVQGPVELNYQPITHIVSEGGGQLEIPLSFEKGVKVFHLIINGESLDKGVPDWIHYTHISDTEGSLILDNINQNYDIYIEVDAWIGEINTAVLTPEQIEAINNMNVMLGEDLALTYDKEVLPIDFQLQGENLIVTSDMDGISFKINAKKELEVTYDDGNSN